MLQRNHNSERQNAWKVKETIVNYLRQHKNTKSIFKDLDISYINEPAKIVVQIQNYSQDRLVAYLQDVMGCFTGFEPTHNNNDTVTLTGNNVSRFLESISAKTTEVMSASKSGQQRQRANSDPDVSIPPRDQHVSHKRSSSADAGNNTPTQSVAVNKKEPQKKEKDEGRKLETAKEWVAVAVMYDLITVSEVPANVEPRVFITFSEHCKELVSNETNKDLINRSIAKAYQYGIYYKNKASNISDVKEAAEAINAFLAKMETLLSKKIEISNMDAAFDLMGKVDVLFSKDYFAKYRPKFDAQDSPTSKAEKYIDAAQRIIQANTENHIVGKSLMYRANYCLEHKAAIIEEARASVEESKKQEAARKLELEQKAKAEQELAVAKKYIAAHKENFDYCSSAKEIAGAFNKSSVVQQAAYCQKNEALITRAVEQQKKAAEAEKKEQTAKEYIDTHKEIVAYCLSNKSIAQEFANFSPVQQAEYCKKHEASLTQLVKAHKVFTDIFNYANDSKRKDDVHCILWFGGTKSGDYKVPRTIAEIRNLAGKTEYKDLNTLDAKQMKQLCKDIKEYIDSALERTPGIPLLFRTRDQKTTKFYKEAQQNIDVLQKDLEKIAPSVSVAPTH